MGLALYCTLKLSIPLYDTAFLGS
uniref:Uncharacterized protein n=1 Tax=Anguilla anguilla TaxID=7936 RepID=A0A0E9T7F6_ANGAN